MSRPLCLVFVTALVTLAPSCLTAQSALHDVERIVLDAIRSNRLDHALEQNHYVLNESPGCTAVTSGTSTPKRVTFGAKLTLHHRAVTRQYQTEFDSVTGKLAGWTIHETQTRLDSSKLHRMVVGKPRGGSVQVTTYRNGKIVSNVQEPLALPWTFAVFILPAISTRNAAGPSHSTLNVFSNRRNERFQLTQGERTEKRGSELVRWTRIDLASKTFRVAVAPSRRIREATIAYGTLTSVPASAFLRYQSKAVLWGNERRAVTVLAVMAHRQTIQRNKTGHYAEFEELASFEPKLPRRIWNSYELEMVVSKGRDKWLAVARPLVQGKTGNRTFVVVQGEKVHVVPSKVKIQMREFRIPTQALPFRR